MKDMEGFLYITIFIGSLIAIFLVKTDQIHKAIELFNKCLILLNATAQGMEDAITPIYRTIYMIMCKAYRLISDFKNAEKNGRKMILIKYDSGDAVKEGKISLAIARISRKQNNFEDAKELYERAIKIMLQTGDRKGEADACGEFGSMFLELSEYAKAKAYIERALVIRKEIGDKDGEARANGNLGIQTLIGDRNGEAIDYGNLGSVLQSLGEFVKAKEYLNKALAINIEIGDRSGEATDYGELGTVYYSLGEYAKAEEYLEKALAIRREIGDRSGEATDYGNLGTVFQALGEYLKAIEYHEKALAMTIETGDRRGEAVGYGNLGNVLRLLGEYDTAKEYLEKSLEIKTEMGYRGGEAVDYGNLAIVSHALDDYAKAKEYFKKSLAIQIEIGDRKGEATAYGNLGDLCYERREYVKAQEYYEKALAIRIEIGDREGEAEDYNGLGDLFLSLDEYNVAEIYLEKAVKIAKDIGAREIKLESLTSLVVLRLSQGNIQEALLYLSQSIQIFEDLRKFIGDNDQFKTSFFERRGVFPYFTFSRLLCDTNNPRYALYVEDLARARGLADLMAAKYSVETHISAKPLSWSGIENITRKETNCVFLYISYDDDNEVYIWIMKTSGAIHFKRTTVGEEILGADGNLSHFFAKHFRSLGILPEGKCEDRSLFNIVKPQRNSDEIESLADLRLVEEDDEEVMDLKSSLSLCYKSIIAPVADFLEEREVIIVPHRSLYKVPFAALSEKEGKYLSETHRIRIVPSLTTLKLIQDSPADYHSQTGALIVGDPNVGWVMYKGRREYVTSLPCARNEAEMVGRLVTVTPLLGDQATKQAVLEKITSVSLIHFAAHGDAERGEIALSPIRSPDSPDIAPQEEDYLLTMADISQVKVRAKLVVLSCCHSARGQIRVEGVIGIARAFLGSGARSVLVALWAIEDTATEQLMSRFYEHLVCGESASESLHQAMKWMRNNGFTKVWEIVYLRDSL